MRMRLALIIFKFLVPTRNLQKNNQLKPLINLFLSQYEFLTPLFTFSTVSNEVTAVIGEQKQELNFPNEFDVTVGNKRKANNV